MEEKVDNACEWCKEHWKEILITVIIVIGAVLAIEMVTSVSKLANFGTSNQLLINIRLIRSIFIKWKHHQLVKGEVIIENAYGICNSRQSK